VVTPNTCALPERGGRKFVGSNSNKGGLGYFHPHAQFHVDASSETGPPTIFSANVTVGNVNDRGSLGLFMKKRPGPMYDYDHDHEYDQHSSDDRRTQLVISSLFDRSPELSDLANVKLKRMLVERGGGRVKNILVREIGLGMGLCQVPPIQMV